jgi:hypothetical protein
MADAAEVQKTRAKMLKEVAIWTQYVSEIDNFARVSVGMKSELLDSCRAEQRVAIETWQESTFPVRDFECLSHAITFTEACNNRNFADSAKVHQIFWVNTTVLGYDAGTTVAEAIPVIAGLVAAKPEATCILVAAPTVGPYGNEYNEAAIEEGALKIRNLLCNPDLRLLCRDVYLQFDPESVAQQSKRPGVHRFFMAISDQANAGTLVSLFSNSTLWRRQIVPNICSGKMQTVPMLPVKNMIDARRDFTTAGANQGLSRPAIRKQWVAGWQVAAAFHDSLWHGTGVSNNAVASWMDVFAYDHSLAECLTRRSKDKAYPQQMYVGTVYAEMGTRGAPGVAAAACGQAVDAQRVSRWLQMQIRRRLQTLACEGITQVPNWKPLPEYRDQRVPPQMKESDFTVLHPAAAKNLPIRQEVMEMMETRLQSSESKLAWQELIKEHNEVWNPSGQAWENKRKSDANSSGGPAKKPRLVEQVAGQPQTLDELEKKFGHYLTLNHVPGIDIFVCVAGSIWAQATEDVTITDLTKPLVLVYGQFKVGSDRVLFDCFAENATHINVCFFLIA